MLSTLIITLIINIVTNVDNNNIKNMNIYYIRAAIFEATGIKLTIDEVGEYLISEGLASESQIKKSRFTGYGDFYEVSKSKESLELDVVDIINSNVL